MRDAFAENFTARGERGAALCVTVDGRVVVDLWGGHRDADGRAAWAPDTLVNAFSVGKPFAVLALGRVLPLDGDDVERPVATIWPEFAANGKADVTIRQLLSHQAGLPAIRRRLSPDAMYDWATMTSALAAEAPWWVPGQGHGYHVNTFGFLVGELVRRLAGRSIGAVLAAEVAGPLDADVHIGLARHDHPRVADFAWAGDPPPEEEPADVGPDELMAYNAYFNPSGLSGAGVVNTRAWREAEIPSTNTHASARGVARIYAALAAGGRLDGHEVVAPGALAAATTEVVCGPDLVLGRPSRFGLGFQLTQPERPLGPNPGAHGHFGAGGSLGFCDPEAGVAFGYVMNELGSRWQNPRNRALIDAVYASLA